MSDDTQLIKRLQNKEEPAWAEVVALYYDRLHLVCGRFVRNQGDAQDLVHETFVKAMGKIERFDTSRFSTLRPWLWQIARNVGLDYVRSRKHKEDKWQSLPTSQSATSQTFLKIRDSKPGPRTKVQEKG